MTIFEAGKRSFVVGNQGFGKSRRGERVGKRTLAQTGLLNSKGRDEMGGGREGRHRLKVRAVGVHYLQVPPCSIVRSAARR